MTEYKHLKKAFYCYFTILFFFFYDAVNVTKATSLFLP